ncbi:MAG: outer membrane protein transport protein [Alphaproteobacteria bacterium]|nr:outer membrane protein transport protein [Alphaproteobacteria bacterium]
MRYTAFAALGAAVIALGLAAGEALASGFQIKEQSSSKLGNAFAGAGASGDDASILYFNPAGLALFDTDQIQVDSALIVPHAEFSVTSATSGAGTTMTGGDGGDAGQPALVPSLYGVWTVNDRVNLGLSVNAPFGLITSYDDDWAGRYHAITSELHTIMITPSASYKVTDKLSIGGGPFVMYADARLTNGIDFGTICVGSLGASTCSAAGVTPQGADGNVDLQGDDWGYGFAGGLLYEPIKGSRIGLSYRSHTRLKVEGNADFSVPSNASFLTASGAFTDTAVSGTITLPEIVGLSLHHDINDRWAVMADVVWTRWSRFEELRFDFENTAQPDSVTAENWNDTFFTSVGATYKPADGWTLRGGLAFDESPVDDNFRTARIPDQNRYWAAFGADYKIADRITLTAGYTHIWVDDASLNSSGSTTGTLVGNYEASIDIITLGASIRF